MRLFPLTTLLTITSPILIQAVPSPGTPIHNLPFNSALLTKSSFVAEVLKCDCSSCDIHRGKCSGSNCICVRGGWAAALSLEGWWGMDSEGERGG